MSLALIYALGVVVTSLIVGAHFAHDGGCLDDFSDAFAAVGFGIFWPIFAPLCLLALGVMFVVRTFGGAR